MGKHLFRSSPPQEKQPAHQTLAESAVQECMSKINRVISKWTSPSPSSDAHLFSTNSRREAEEFAEAVRHLHITMHRLAAVNPSSEKLVYAQNLMQSAMNLLESEFHRVLMENRQYLDPECVSVRSYRSSRFASTPTSVSDSEDETFYEENAEEHRFSGGDSDAMDDLKMIADCMISTGYAKECVKVYKTVRRSIVDETLHGLAVERFTLHQVQKMDWDTLESKIRTWLPAVKLAVRSLFFGERLLADHVFSSSLNIVESSFTDITQEGALTLFTFPENVAKIKKLSPEKMFRFLDMYESLASLFVDLRQRAVDRRPVEPEAGRLLLHLVRVRQRRQCGGHAVEDARAALLGALDRVPVAQHVVGALDLRRAEDVRVTADELVVHPLGDIGDREPALLLGDRRVELDLVQQITELLDQVVERPRIVKPLAAEELLGPCTVHHRVGIGEPIGRGGRGAGHASILATFEYLFYGVENSASGVG